MASRRLARVLGRGVLVCLIWAALAGSVQARSTALSSIRPGAGSSLHSPARYLIVAPDDFLPLLADFIALKQAQGLQVNTLALSQAGQSAVAIKGAIEAVYYSAQRPDYLLLVGDESWIPGWDCQSNHAMCRSGSKRLFQTDLHYATMDGPGDFGADMAYGRFPAADADQLAAILDKYLAYAALEGHEPWLRRAAFIASADPDLWPIFEGAHEAVITAHTAPLAYTGAFPTDPQPGGDRLYAWTHAAAKADVLAALEAGRSLLVYAGLATASGWSSPAFGLNDLAGLNAPPLSLVASFAPYTARLDAAESFAEAWLTEPEKGALAFLGAHFWTDADLDAFFEEALFDALFSQPSSALPIGQAVRQALADVYLFTAFDSRGQYYQEVYQLMGDPAFVLRLPPDFSLQVNPSQLALCVPNQNQPQAGLSVEIWNHPELPVALALPVLPDGMTASFNPAAVLAHETSTLTLTIEDQMAAGDYPLIITGDNGSSRAYTQLLLMLRSALPAVPLPQDPAPNQDSVPLRPSLRWSPAEGAVTYDLQVATDFQFSHISVDLPGLFGTEYTLGEDLLPGQAYYWRVRAVNPCGAGAYSRPARFTTRPLPGECPLHADQLVAYHADFDEGADGWSTAGSVPGWTWQTTVTRGGSPGGWYAAVPAHNSDQTLRSPLLEVPPLAQSPITFSTWMKYEFGSLDSCLDGGRVEYSTDEGITWQPLPEDAILTPPYDGSLALSENNPLAGQRAWCHSRDWTRLVIDLDEYSGQSVLLRYRLATDSQSSAWGWALDDASLQSCLYPPHRSLALSPSAVTQLVPPGGEANFTFEINNTGWLPDEYAFELNHAGWDYELADASLRLDPGQSAPLVLRLRVPADAVPASEHTFNFIAASQEDPAVWAASQLTVVVRSHGVTLAAASAQTSAHPGELVHFTVTLGNSGNGVDTFDLAASAPPDWVLDYPASLALSGGASTSFSLTTRVPSGAADRQTQLLRLTAQSQSQPQAAASLDLLVEVRWRRLYLPVLAR